MLGEVQDKFSQTEVNESEMAELDALLADSHTQQKESERSGGGGSILKGLLSQIPNSGDLSRDADRLEQESDAQEMANLKLSHGGPNSAAKPSEFDAMKVIKQIYPILQFRDRVVRAIESTIEKIPGLSALVEKISDTLSVFVFSLLAPFVRPILAQATTQLQAGSSEVLDSSAQHQFEPWDIPTCTDPTHSLLSKDHFSNKLNPAAGEVASAIVGYVVPRVIYAYENPNVPVEQVLDDVVRVLHHPAIRDPNCEIHSLMFETVQKWVERQPDRGRSLNQALSREGVRAGQNHIGGVFAGGHNVPAPGGHAHVASGGHGKTKGGEWDRKQKKKKAGGYKSKPEASGGGGLLGGLVPGPLGGVVGGILDAGIAGFNSGKEGGGGGGERRRDYGDEYGSGREYKEKKYEYDEYGHKKYTYILNWLSENN